MLEVDFEGKTPSYMALANLKYMLKKIKKLDDDAKKQNELLAAKLQNELLAGILKGNMAPYYLIVCSDLEWIPDEKLLTDMQKVNNEKLAQFEKEDPEKTDGEDETNLWKDKLEYLCSIGDKDASVKLATEKSEDTSLSTNCRIEAILAIFRIAYFHDCKINLMKSAIDKATELLEGGTLIGADWSTRNKLKVYEAVCCLGMRDYARAACLFLDAVPTFESYELIDFGTLINYTIFSCMIGLTRCEMKKKLEKTSTLTQVLYSHYADLRLFYEHLYHCRYKEFFKSLAQVETYMKTDRLLIPHYKHYAREMRLKAYSQLIQAYRSLSLKSMAESFGVTEEYIEKEVSRFAAIGRLQCKIDAVAKTVVTCGHIRPDDGVVLEFDRGILYQTTIKHGDIMLNRLKKLTRVMDF